MPIKAVQQFMLGTVLNNEQQAKETLAAMKAAGYDGIELCGFMIHPIGFVVKLLTKAAGMPVRLVFRVGEPPKVSAQENLQNLLKFGSQFDNIQIK